MFILLLMICFYSTYVYIFPKFILELTLAKVRFITSIKKVINNNHSKNCNIIYFFFFSYFNIASIN